MLYATATLLDRLLEDPANTAIIENYRRSLDASLHAAYEVRRIYDAGRTNDCPSITGGSAQPRDGGARPSGPGRV